MAKVHRFDRILNGPDASAAPWDKVLDASPSFVAFPSLGSLVSGWVLVVPREPMLNLSQLSSEQATELENFGAKVAKKIGCSEEEIFMFEHGSHARGGLVGCGVDQAHLHIAPLPFDLIAAALAECDGAVDWIVNRSDAQFTDLTVNDADYVGICHPASRRGVTGLFRQPQSQWLRRIIAREIGLADDWNYRSHPFKANMLLTAEAYGRS